MRQERHFTTEINCLLSKAVCRSGRRRRQFSTSQEIYFGGVSSLRLNIDIPFMRDWNSSV